MRPSYLSAELPLQLAAGGAVLRRHALAGALASYVLLVSLSPGLALCIIMETWGREGREGVREGGGGEGEGGRGGKEGERR